MAWGKAGYSTLTGNATDVEVTGMSTNKFLTILNHTIPTGRVQLVQYTGNGSFVTSGNKYAYRGSVNGNTDIPYDDLNAIEIGSSISAVYTDTRFSIIYVFNESSKEKLMIGSVINANGSSSAPDKEIAVAKWANTSTVMDQWQSHDIETGNQTTDTNLSILGSDFTAGELKVQDGAVFYEKDTNKSYVLYNGIWSEL